MYKLLIVDDEEFEREGMAQLIDWGKYDIEMAGTAWNGVDALRKMEELRPDIILTDVKMPVMNGIELIRKVKEKYPDIEFAVISGYGEYEFTSQAMEEGVKHYILKPCDEEKVVEVIGKVKRDVDTRRAAARREKEYLSRVVPEARKQLFRNLLLDRETENGESLFRFQEEDVPRDVRLLVFRSRESFDGIEEFMLENMLEELLGNGQVRVFVITVVRNDGVLLISDTEPGKLIPIARRIGREFRRIRKEPIRTAVSPSGKLTDLAVLYQQTEELFRIGEDLKGEALLHYGMFDGRKQDVDLLVDFDIVGRTRDYAELLQSLQLTFLRLQKRGFSFSGKRGVMDWILRLLYGEGVEKEEEWIADESGQALMVSAARQIYRHCGEPESESKEMQRYRRILEEIYRHFQDQEFGLRYLATEILFMNEDYFGRFFQKMSGKKFTAFLQDARISAGEQLMRLEPDIMVCAVSEMLGYASDGQYFSKIFKKSTGMTPSEYRASIPFVKGRQ